MRDGNDEKIDLFLDCGAVSIYNKLVRKGGRTESGVHTGAYFKDRKHDDFSYIHTKEYQEYRDSYIEFIKKNKKHLTVYSNLDVINNAELTWENQKIMEGEGLSPIPVYHISNKPGDTKWLKKYIDKGYDYIALGGGYPNPPKETFTIYDRIWNDILTDDKGMPIVKVHGYAVTSLKTMLRYPWYSVDSTSWVMTARMGSIYIPKSKNGKYIYDIDPFKILVSNRSPRLCDSQWHIAHISRQNKELHKYILDYFDFKGFILGESDFKVVDDSYKPDKNERLMPNDVIKKWRMMGDKSNEIIKDKFNVLPSDGEKMVEIIKSPGLCNSYISRDEACIIYFTNLQNALPEWPTPFKLKKKTKSKGLFKVYKT